MDTFNDYMHPHFLPQSAYERESARVDDYVVMFDNFDGINPVVKIFGGQIEFINRHMLCVGVMKGQVELVVDGEKHQLTARTISYMSPHSVVKNLVGSDDMCFFVYSISPDAMRDIYKEMDMAFKMPSKYKRFAQKKLSGEDMKYRLALYNEMRRDLERTSSDYQKLLAQAYLCVLYSNDIDLFELDAPDSEKAISRQHSLFRRFVELLGEYSNKEREVQFYAKQMGITPKYLSALCIEYSGKNASAWIDDYVISRVKFLMQEHRYNIKEIAQVMNFPTQSFFGRYFKRVTGQSPRHYMITNGL